jgi:hypothetical protein
MERILLVIQQKARTTIGSTKGRPTLKSLETLLLQFRRMMDELTATMKPESGIRSFGKRLKWSFRKNGVAEILNSIQRYQLLFVLALQNDHLYHLIFQNVNLEASSRTLSNIRSKI